MTQRQLVLLHSAVVRPVSSPASCIKNKTEIRSAGEAKRFLLSQIFSQGVLFSA